ncbi:glucose-6-phosphate dehydrogenase, partial [Halodesulfovibrio aestuarii]
MPSIKATYSSATNSCEELTPDSCGIIIFGASGDLVYRKLIPALFNLYTRNLMPITF